MEDGVLTEADVTVVGFLLSGADAGDDEEVAAGSCASPPGPFSKAESGSDVACSRVIVSAPVFPASLKFWLFPPFAELLRLLDLLSFRIGPSILGSFLSDLNFYFFSKKKSSLAN